MKNENSRFVNLGCGSRYINGWTNVDFYRTGPDVIACNLLEGLPFGDATFDVVYHSHVLEHFSRESAAAFLGECHRILRKGGVMRVVVPDLEQIVIAYLKNLNRAIQGDNHAEHDYEWSLLELMDQMVRNSSGGGMREYWSQSQIANEKYVEARMGDEFTSFRKNILNSPRRLPKASYRSGIKKWLLNAIARDKLASRYFEIGKFRLSGEVHQWMYDRYSLKRLLISKGFRELTEVSAFSSAIPEWSIHSWLDIENGRVRKPDSLFMECSK